jgi:NADH:quinone reductase (non-electrogenic)
VTVSSTTSPPARRAGRPHVVIIGAGFGGLAAARALLGDVVDVTLVDANNFHTFQPLLYQVATAGLDGENVAYAIRGSVRGRRRRPSNVNVRMARVTAIDVDARTVTLVGGDRLRYDALLLASGAVSNDFGIPGVAEHTLPLKHVDDALAMRVHVLSRFEEAVADPSIVADGALDVVICGGGPTGVEMAGGLHELYQMVLAKDFPQLPVHEARIVLVEMGDRLLAPFSPRSSERARQALLDRGVDVRLGASVASVERELVHLADGTSLRAGTVVWATGVKAEGLAAVLGTPTTHGGRLVVEADLSVPGHPEVFAIGDIAAAPGADGEPLPQVAQPAIQGGEHAARQVRRRLAGEPTEPFAYHDKGQMATIGRHDAVAELPNGWRFSGVIGWVAWLGLHLLYLMGFRNRIKVFVDWSWNYLTYDRGSRVLRESDRQVAEQEPA